ncbi:extracellular solute-binding protein [Rhodococcus erythropolis]|uniref:extracellular solute-binding protein n=1 Tax=Rhodococcus erythropolis TaxID=1833 RepID=UPI001292A03B|nr:extracellular solute-binding protein [Rhodococcus erythropolis]MQP33482.1 extracellular solute-binding protein [Rhodococcus erythropolis]
MRFRTTALALLATSAVVAGCGAPDTTSTDAGAAPGPSALTQSSSPVTITLWHGLGGSGGEALQAAVDDFNRTNPDKINATAIYQGNYADTQAKYGASIRDKTTPDALLVSDIGTGYMHDVGQTVPATDMAEANPDDLALDDLRPAARNYYSADGELLAVPFNVSQPMLYVNGDMIRQAGLPENTSLATLEQVATAATAIHTALPDKAGLGLWMNGWVFEQLSAASGSDFCTPENGRSGDGATQISLTAEAQKKAFTTVAELARSGAGIDIGTSGDNNTNAFLQGNVAMMINSSGAAANVAKGAGFDYQALPLPLSGDRAQSGPVIGGAALWVSRAGHSDAQQVAAWKLVSYLASPSVQEKFSQATGFASANSTVDQSQTQQDFLGKNAVAATLTQQLADTPTTTATAGCLTGAMTGVRENVVQAMQSVVSGNTTLDDGLARATADANKTIASYREQAGK